MQDNKDNFKEFQPYIKPEQSISEFSVRAIVLGIILSVVFGAANAYVGLKIGMTVSASIPAAVISMAILRGFFKKGTVLENNMVQTIGSSGESLAAGIIFTVPALIFLGVAPSILEIFIMSALGGCLGILIPPSVMLVVMGPVLGVSVIHLFAAAIVPGVLLSGLYIGYAMVRSFMNPALGPPLPLVNSGHGLDLVANLAIAG